MSLVCVLETPNRAQFDSACSLLRHEGIPFELRETRGGIVPYFTRDELRIFVAAPHAEEVAELLALLDQPAFPAYQPYRNPELIDEDVEEEEDEPMPSRNATRAMVLLALTALAVVVVTVGLVLAMRETFTARPGPSVTPQAFEYGATSSRAFRGR